MDRRLKTFDAFVNENELGGGLPQTVRINSLTPLQFVKLIDFLEADIEAYGAEDLSYYEEITGINTQDLLDLYIGYGYKSHRYTRTKKIIAAYEKSSGKTMKTLREEAHKEEMDTEAEKWDLS